MTVGDWSEGQLQGYIQRIIRQEQKKNTDPLPIPATTLGSVVGRIDVADSNGRIVGAIPVYNTIT